MSGQSVMDRVQAARHSVLGSQIGKKVCKATTEEILAPKRKHLEDLLQYSRDPNVNVTDIIDQLLSRTHNQNWVVVYKALITLHHMMCYGHEKVIQNMASRTMELNLSNYYDRKDMQGSQMSPFIQRYSKYLCTKAGSYRTVAFDFCNAKRGREEGKLRNMDSAELLMALPALSDQLEALLAFQARSVELQNGIIVASFMLLFKDCIRLFASYNEGIINLLEKYFDMSKRQCEEALKVYKTFLGQMEKVGAFLKTAEQESSDWGGGWYDDDLSDSVRKAQPMLTTFASLEFGIDKGDIPDLTSAPSSLLDALEAHYQSLESEKKSGSTTTKKTKMQLPKQLSVNAEAFAAVSTKPTTNNPFFFDNDTNSSPPPSGDFSDADKQRALEEESRELDKFNSQMKASNPFAADFTDSGPTAAAPAANKPQEVLDPFDDLLGGGGGSAQPVSTTNTGTFDPFGGSTASNASSGFPFGGSGVASFDGTPANSNSSNPFLQSTSPATMSNPSLYPGMRQPSPAMPAQNMNVYQGSRLPPSPYYPGIAAMNGGGGSFWANNSNSAVINDEADLSGLNFGSDSGVGVGSAQPAPSPANPFGSPDQASSNPAGGGGGKLEEQSSAGQQPNYNIDITEFGLTMDGPSEPKDENKDAAGAFGMSTQPSYGVGGGGGGSMFNGSSTGAPGTNQINFEAAFPNSNQSTGTGASIFGDILQPTPAGGASPMGGGNPYMMSQPAQPNLYAAAPPMSAPSKSQQNQPQQASLGKDLDSALANLASSLSTK